MVDYSEKPLMIILGPTASGKTALSVGVARQLNGAILSADSRQIYKGMDIGTGKDLSEYQNIPYYGIDIREPDDHYHVAQFRNDADKAIAEIRHNKHWPIVCGGTGLYIQSLVQGLPYSDIPIDPPYRKQLELSTTIELQKHLQSISLPSDFNVDTSTRKRMIRAIEIGRWLQHTPAIPKKAGYPSLVFGLNPPLEVRRTAISIRLQKRLSAGLVEEVENLLNRGLSFDQLIYYGLEYKYTSFYLRGDLTFDEFVVKLTTEINRFAKRQMTFFRKLEKDGLVINWIKSQGTLDRTQEILDTLDTNERT